MSRNHSTMATVAGHDVTALMDFEPFLFVSPPKDLRLAGGMAKNPWVAAPQNHMNLSKITWDGNQTNPSGRQVWITRNSPSAFHRQVLGPIQPYHIHPLKIRSSKSNTFNTFLLWVSDLTQIRHFYPISVGSHPNPTLVSYKCRIISKSDTLKTDTSILWVSNPT